MPVIASKPEEQARTILCRFFTLQRVALGGQDPLSRELERGGWTLDHHMRLVRILGDGCHNLAELASGNWWDSNRLPASNDILRDSLRHECLWLYDRAEKGLPYPAAWDRDDSIANAWHRFWEAVAAPLDLPVQYGRAYEKVESREEALRRLRHEAESRALLQYLPWWARLLFGWRDPIFRLDVSGS